MGSIRSTSSRNGGMRRCHPERRNARQNFVDRSQASTTVILAQENSKRSKTVRKQESKKATSAEPVLKLAGSYPTPSIRNSRCYLRLGTLILTAMVLCARTKCVIPAVSITHHHHHAIGLGQTPKPYSTWQSPLALKSRSTEPLCSST